MKNNYMKKFVIFAAMALAAVACGPKEGPKPAPVFPEETVKYISEGESVQISFDVNASWTVRITGKDSPYFYMMDKGMQVPQISGEAGYHTIQVSVKATGGNQKSCKLSMTMGDITQDIAAIYTESGTKELKVFAGKVNDKGSFTIVGGGEYEYENVETKSLHVFWPEDMYSYTLPLKIESNFNWSMSSYPQWLDPSKTQSEGDQTLLVLHARMDKLPLENASGSISIMNSNTQQVLFTLQVSIDGCKNVARYSVPGEKVSLNVLGQYYSSNILQTAGCPLTLTATTDSDIVALECVDGAYSFVNYGDCWLNVTRDVESGSDVVRQITYHVTAGRNDGAERSMVILGIPGAVLRGINPATGIVAGGQIKSEYTKYIMTTIVQKGLDPAAGYGLVCPLNTPYEMAVYGADLVRTPSADPSYAALRAKYETTEIYTANLTGWSSGDNMLLNINADYNTVAFNVGGVESSENDHVSMEYPQESDKSTFRFSVDSFEDGYETAVVLKSGSKAKAVVICRMSLSYWPKIDYNDIYFVGEDNASSETASEMLPQGATLEELTSGELYDKYKSYEGVHVWRLTYETVESIRNAMFYVPPFPMENPNAIAIDPLDKPWLEVESAYTENNRVYIHVTMKNISHERGPKGVVVLQGGGRPLFVLECVRQFVN